MVIFKDLLSTIKVEGLDTRLKKRKTLRENTQKMKRNNNNILGDFLKSEKEIKQKESINKSKYNQNKCEWIK